MMIPYRVLGWVIGLASIASLSHADQRVLFRFDEAGVQVNRVMQIEETGDFSRSSSARSLKGMPESLILMRWLDRNGVVLASTEVADPRVSHSPNHTDAFVQSRYGLASGAWVANGPDGAESVSVELPENAALGLPTETWVLSLSSR